MKGLRAWPEGIARSGLFRGLLRHQFWRKAFGRLGPRYIVARVGPLRMYLDLRETLGVSRYILKHGSYDSFISERVGGWIGGQGNAIDLGANIGYYSLLAATSTRGQVHSFEPEPHNFELLLGNIELNGLRNIHPIRKAAGDRRSTLRLYLSRKNAGDHRCFEAGKPRESVPVEVVRVDEELAGIQGVSFVKIDVQGFEERCVRGMEGILTGNRKVTVLSEFHPESIVASGAEPRAFLDFMESLGFRWLVASEEDRKLVEMERPALFEACAGGAYADLVFHRD